MNWQHQSTCSELMDSEFSALAVWERTHKWHPRNRVNKEHREESAQDKTQRWIEGQDKNGIYVDVGVFICSIGWMVAISNQTKGISRSQTWHPLWWNDSPTHSLQLSGSDLLLPLSPRLKLGLTYSLLRPMFLFRKLEHGTKLSLLTSQPLLS